jgi:hypothetical protein
MKKYPKLNIGRISATPQTIDDLIKIPGGIQSPRIYDVWASKAVPIIIGEKLLYIRFFNINQLK